MALRASFKEQLISSLKPHRLLLTIVAFAIVGGAFLYLGQHPPGHGTIYPGCFFRKATGLNCVGCGMTRATHLLANGRLLEALRMNVLGVILLPILTATCTYALIAWCRNRPLPNWQLPRWGPWLIFSVLLLFAILRNIPHYPFTLLAPTGLTP